MNIKEVVTFGREDKGIFFEAILIFDNESRDRRQGYYLKLIPVEVTKSKKVIKRYHELSRTRLVLEAERESKTSFKEACYIRDKIVDDLLKEIDESSELIQGIEMHMENLGERDDSMDRRGDGLGGRARTEEREKEFVAQKDSNLKFSDVAGLKEVKEELYEIVDSVKNKAKYEKMGAKLPRGILFYGPPGTGKTLLAKALAGETKSRFFYVAGSEFTEKYVGVGAQRVRKLFDKARKQAPSIIFIDEIDSIGAQRNSDTNSEKDQTLNQLLTEMDGFKDCKDVVVIGATNRLDLLDDALKRAGRFNKHVYIGNPDLESRKELFEIHTKNKPLDENVDLETLAKKTHGFNGADIENIANESALLAIREDRETISQENLEDALEKVIGGLKSSSKKLREQEKQIVSYHEAGHALVGMKLGVNKIQKISIIPHGQALGFVISLPEEDRYLYTKEDLENKLKGLLAGRVAEEVKFGHYSTGASDDLKKATRIAVSMVCDYGMNEEAGLITRDISSIDKLTDIEKASVNKILNTAYEETKNMLISNMDRLEKIAEYLFENEEMDIKDMDALFKDDMEMASFISV